MIGKMTQKTPVKHFKRSDLEDCDRSSFDGFVKYYTARPYMFRNLFGYKPKNSNMREAFDKLKKLRLQLEFVEPETICQQRCFLYID